MRRSLRVSCLAINVACVLVYLYAIHRIRSLMALEQRTEADGGDVVLFFGLVAPAFVVALLTNVAWLAKALADVSRKDYAAIKWVGAGTAVWLIALLGRWLL